MKTFDIINETVSGSFAAVAMPFKKSKKTKEKNGLLEANRPINIPFADGSLWIGDHFLQRADQRLSRTEYEIIVRLLKNLNESQLIEEIKNINPQNMETFVIYNSDYFGISILKRIEFNDKTKNESIAYVLSTSSHTLYPKEGQKLYMIDNNPRRFTYKDYQNMPADMKRYIVETWKRHNFSKKDIQNIYDELKKQQNPSPQNEENLIIRRIPRND